MILQFDVINQRIVRKDDNYIVANSQFYLQMDFNFTQDWVGFGKTITFVGAAKKYSIGLTADNSCVVPYEVIKTPSFSFSIKGMLNDVIITTNVCVVPIKASGETHGVTPVDPPKEILSGLQNGLKGQVLGKLSDDNYDYEFQNLKELQYDNEHTLGDVLEGLVIDAVTDVIYEDGKLKKQENGEWADIVEMYDKDTIDTMLANLDKYIEKSDTPGLVKNDGTIDETQYASQDDLNTAKTDLQGDIEALDTKLSQDISNEENARIAAISAEETARGNADTALGGRIDAEELARSQADTALGGRIDTEITDRGNAITAEASAREQADNLKANKSTKVGGITLQQDTEVLDDYKVNGKGLSVFNTNIDFTSFPIEDEIYEIYSDDDNNIIIELMVTSQMIEGQILQLITYQNEQTESYIYSNLDLPEEMVGTALNKNTWYCMNYTTHQISEKVPDPFTANVECINQDYINVYNSIITEEAVKITLKQKFDNIKEDINDLSKELNDTKEDLSSKINDEIINRENADTTLQGNIDAEVSARQQADNLKVDKTTTVGGISLSSSTKNLDDYKITSNKGFVEPVDWTMFEDLEMNQRYMIYGSIEDRENMDLPCLVLVKQNVSSIHFNAMYELYFIYNEYVGFAITSIMDSPTMQGNKWYRIDNPVGQSTLVGQEVPFMFNVDRTKINEGFEDIFDAIYVNEGGKSPTTLINRLNDIDQTISDEATARQNQDGVLQGNIDAESLARQQADSAEANIRDTNDDALASAISDRLCIVKMNNVILNNWTDVGIPQEFENYSYVAVIRDTKIIGAQSVNVLFTIEQILSDNYCPAPLVDNVEGTIKIFGNDDMAITIPSVEIFKEIEYTIPVEGE